MKIHRLALIPLLALVQTFLLAAPAAAQAPWTRVQALAPGSPVVVARDDMSGTRDRIVVFADADTLVALNLTGLDLAERDLASLVEAAGRFTRPTPGRASEAVTVDAARISPEGLWIGNQRLGNVDERIERIPRQAIAEIRKPTRTVGSKLGAVLGAAGGAVLGFGTAVNIATENQCGRSCTDEKFLVGAALVGIPVATGWLGYNVKRTRVSEVIYRR